MQISSWLWLAAALYLAFEIWRGWRRGVVRHGVSVGALIVAGGVGWIFALMTGFLSDRLVPLPVPMGRVVFGLAAAVAFYVAAVVLSSLLFRRTAEQPPGLRRLLYGVGGGMFGMIFGLLVIWGGISLVRALGAVVEARSDASRPVSAAIPLDASDHAGGRGLVDRIDILPTEVYTVLTKLLRVTQCPHASVRFFAYPPTQELFSQPKLVDLFNDPAFARAAAEGSYFGLLTNPKLAEAARDPDVRSSFAGFDWEKALDYALREPATSPASNP